MKIFKYHLEPGANEILIPSGAEVVHVGLDPAGEPSVWAKVDPARPLVQRTFHIVGTGHDFPAEWKHLGSFTHANTFVWHLFQP